MNCIKCNEPEAFSDTKLCQHCEYLYDHKYWAMKREFEQEMIEKVYEALQALRKEFHQL